MRDEQVPEKILEYSVIEYPSAVEATTTVVTDRQRELCDDAITKWVAAQ